MAKDNYTSYKGKRYYPLDPETFSANKIDVDISTVNLGYITHMLEDGGINLSPDFQRSTDIWDINKKSRLIESVLMGLPLPSFFFFEDETNFKLSVIDGVQRLCALRDFLDKKNPMRLKGMQFLTNLEGLTYDELPRPEARRMKMLDVTMNVLRKGTPANVTYIIFERINNGGEKLKDQELRHVINNGEASEFLKELAESECFRDATHNAIECKRMKDREYVNHFVAFYTGYDFYNGKLKYFLNERMGLLNRLTEEEREEIKHDFYGAMRCCHDIFGNNAFVTPGSKNKVTTALFDALSVNTAWLDDEERLMLVKNAGMFKQELERLFGDDSFVNSMRNDTNSVKNVKTRFEGIRDIIKRTIDR